MAAAASAALAGTWMRLLPLLAMAEVEGPVTMRLFRRELILEKDAGELSLRDSAEVSRSTDDSPMRFLLICVS